MNGCIYRTKDGECGLWEKDRNHTPFCRPDCDHQHPSNADRIRGMTDEELAEFIASGVPKDVCKDRCGGDESFQCSECVLDWLKEEANE